ncbi:hypothetical protein PGT21_036582 [Puccinia graminis f. sp. tritici]|uniref:Uncharacterized protein n=1 Tax=Puccinia graminis f. sp. tritici TaxID=56615 RepID=A0A5B0NUZ2_PUCGR|nr:hypothetical protein PGT21_036582 [Puccinia graminis f. sp. tritici]
MYPQSVNAELEQLSTGGGPSGPRKITIRYAQALSLQPTPSSSHGLWLPHQPGRPLPTLRRLPTGGNRRRITLHQQPFRRVVVFED